MERIDATAIATTTNWADNNLITRNGKDVNNNPINGTPRAQNSVSKSETQLDSPSVLPFDEFDALTFTQLGNPYIIGNTLYVPQQKTLNIEPGVVLQFKAGQGAEIQGTLKALGEDNNKIVFTSFQEPSSWGGLYFTETSTSSELIWSEVKYASRTGLGSPPAILVDNSSISFSHSVLSHYPSRGIILNNSFSVIENSQFLGSGLDISVAAINLTLGQPLIKNNLFQANKYGILLQNCSQPVVEANNFEENETPVYTIYNCGNFPHFSDNDGSNNQVNAIMVRGRMSQPALWHKNFIPYLIEDFFEVEQSGVLTLDPGVVIKSKPDAYLRIKGQLFATSTPAEPIVLTSLRDDEYGGDTNNDGSATSAGPGNWGGLTFGSYYSNEGGGLIFVPAKESVLENVIVRYGGYWNAFWPEQGLVSALESVIKANGLKVQYGSKAGLYLKNSASVIADSYFENNQIGLYIEGEAVPQITNGHFANNQKAAIYWPSGGQPCQDFAIVNPGLSVDCECCRY
jgi:parallel beta-helix repeat protein